MNLLKQTLEILTQAHLIESYADFSNDFANRNTGWLSYTLHKQRDVNVETAINILRQTRHLKQTYEQKQRRILGESVIVLCRMDDSDDKHAMAGMDVVDEDGSLAIMCRNSWGDLQSDVVVTREMFVSAYTTEINVSATYVHEDGNFFETENFDETEYGLWHAAMHRKQLLGFHAQ